VTINVKRPTSDSIGQVRWRCRNRGRVGTFANKLGCYGDPIHEENYAEAYYMQWHCSLFRSDFSADGHLICEACRFHRMLDRVIRVGAAMHRRSGSASHHIKKRPKLKPTFRPME
jgi:hypothetical protein